MDDPVSSLDFIQVLSGQMEVHLVQTIKQKVVNNTDFEVQQQSKVFNRNSFDNLKNSKKAPKVLSLSYERLKEARFEDEESSKKTIHSQRTSSADVI